MKALVAYRCRRTCLAIVLAALGCIHYSSQAPDSETESNADSKARYTKAAKQKESESMFLFEPTLELIPSPIVCTPEAISQVEQRMVVKFPQEFKQFLLDVNAARVWPPAIPRAILGESDDCSGVQYFAGVDSSPVTELEAMQFGCRFNERVPVGIISFARTDGIHRYCISVRERDYGGIYYWRGEVADEILPGEENSEDELSLVARDIRTFIQDLVPDPAYAP